MRFGFVTLVLIIISFISAGSMNSVHVAGKADKITVFQSGANFNMQLIANVKKGTNIIYIDSLPSQLDINSIRIFFGSKAALMSYDFMLEKIEPNMQGETKELKELKDSIRLLNYYIADLTNNISTLEGEMKIISEFKLHPETEKGSSIQELNTLANYYNKRLNEIKKEILDYNVKISSLHLSVQRINNKISELNLQLNTVQNYQIAATISSEIEGNLNFNLDFYTPNAGWAANYDIKVKDVSSPLMLTYKAQVWQNTGRIWNDVYLTLSTRNPVKSNNLPLLAPWYLNLLARTNFDDISSPLSSENVSTSKRNTYNAEQMMIVDGLQTGTIENKYLTLEFSPSNKYTILSDNRKQSITLNNVEVNTKYEYYAVPKLDNDAFLIAKISDWGQLNLLPGEAYIYFENTYIGKTNINPNTTLDSLSLSLGRDKNIIIERESNKEMTETKFFSSNSIKQYGYKIKIKNNRKSDILITFYDQFPVSRHEKIEVEIVESSGAEIDNEKGFFKWIANIPALKSIERKFGYKIDSPN